MHNKLKKKENRMSLGTELRLQKFVFSNDIDIDMI